MIICGIKITHDGGVALLENGRLRFSIEVEKINNNLRYSEIADLSMVESILDSEHFSIRDVDQFVLDGWHGSEPFSTGEAVLHNSFRGRRQQLKVAPYHEDSIYETINERFRYNCTSALLGFGEYSSFMHGAGHIWSAYSTSPFAKNMESSYVLVWDGGQYPRLYYFDTERASILNLGSLFFFLGTIYSIFSQYFGPYKKSQTQLIEDQQWRNLEGYFGGFSVAGKIMAYIALGKVQPHLLALFRKVHLETFTVSADFEHRFSLEVKRRVQKSYSDEDVLASMHFYLQHLLLSSMEKQIQRHPNFEKNICFVGGCALNIKWNSALKSSGIFNKIWVPPFSNDSGTAIGTAACEWYNQTKSAAIDWSVYCGPEIIKNAAAEGWIKRVCTIENLAKLLFELGEPVVMLNGRAEAGPRALGNRSIIAPATATNMKDVINKVKQREFFRPVAPICLEEFVDEVFEGGFSSPYMLFEQRVRDEWKKRVPAIVHLDETSRPQTVNKSNNILIYELLMAYYRLSNVPLLCNTSANFNGKGFFPDVFSATSWNQLNYVWCEGVLYEKQQKIHFELI
ncbi:Decarbamoylnovobiocin carbamoyltransferase [compost metagenome]